MTPDIDLKLYRPNVAAFIMNSSKKILVGRRPGVPDLAWQIPQGGIDENESPEKAVFREIEEETGLTQLQIVAQTQPWIIYEWPPAFRKKGKIHIGVKQIYFIMHQIVDEVPQNSDELEAFRWEDTSFVLKEVIEFKRAAYLQAIQQLKTHF